MPPPYRAEELADALDGTLIGDPQATVSSLVHPLELTGPDQLVFIMDPALAARLEDPQVPLRMAIVAEGIEIPEGRLAAQIVVKRPRYALASLLDLFEKRVHAPAGIHPSAVVEDGARVAADACIGALAYVGPGATVGARSIVMPQATIGAGATVGEDCLLHPGVRLGERVVVGDRVIIHGNAVIGADGFSFVTPERSSFEAARGAGTADEITTETRGLRRIGSIGTVILGDDVEVGANSAIDRANIGATIIGEGTKIDNHVQIGHNVRVGRWCLMSGQVGLSGSCRIGDRVVLAGRAGIADHISVGDDAIVGAGSGVWRHVEPRQVVLGYPAVPKTQFLQREANIGRLSRLIRDIAAIRKRQDRSGGAS